MYSVFDEVYVNDHITAIDTMRTTVCCRPLCTL